MRLVVVLGDFLGFVKSGGSNGGWGWDRVDVWGEVEVVSGGEWEEDGGVRVVEIGEECFRG